MRTPPPPPDAEPPSLRTIGEGLRYATSRQDLIGTYLVDMNAMFFGMPMALFPAIAKGYGGPEVLGLLYAAPSAGSIAVTLTSGWTARVHRHGRAIVYGAAAWGVAIVAFGFADALWLAVACLVVAGAMDTISGIFRSAIWNETIPDHLRGRLAGVEMISWSSGPLLGDAEAGLLAALDERPRLRGHRRHRVRRRHGRARRRATALLGLRQPRPRGRCRAPLCRTSRTCARKECARQNVFVSKGTFTGLTSKMPTHQFMYPKVTPVPRPAAAPSAPPANGRRAQPR